MPFAELDGALESKATDGQENPSALILSNRKHKARKYVSAAKHVDAVNLVLVSKRLWDTLLPAENKAMNDATNDASSDQRTNSRAERGERHRQACDRAPGRPPASWTSRSKPSRAITTAR